LWETFAPGAYEVLVFHAGTDPQPPGGGPVGEVVGEVGGCVVGGVPPDTVSVSPNT